MTILERVAVQHDRDSFDHDLADRLRVVPGAFALALTDRPSGTWGLLVIEDDVFESSEELAFEAVSEFERGRAGPVNLDMVVLPISQASRVVLSDAARLHDLRPA